MKILVVLSSLAALASAGVLYDQAAMSSSGSSGSADGYGAPQTQTKCEPYFDTIFTDHCEAYTERTCRTTHKESCSDVADQNCRAVVSSKQGRKCFDVEEQLCSLQEDVEFETIQVPFTVQKCQKVTERVCDTVYESSSNMKDTMSCIDVESPQCTSIDKVINDRTCRTTTQFDCQTTYEDSYGGAQAAQAAASQASSSSGYGNQGAQASGYGSAQPEYQSTQSAYGQAQANCRRTTDTKCYKTPRTVSIPDCRPRSEKVCENLRVSVPFVQPRQNCHNEDKKVCSLEQRTQPKQVKKYVYSKKCRTVPRQVCENADEKALVPSCVASTHKECQWTPVENCQDEPKKHCVKVAQKIRKERCETVTTSSGYGGSGASVSSSTSSGGDSGYSSSSSAGGFSSGSAAFGGSGGQDTGY